MPERQRPGQSPTPSSGPEGSDLRSVARQIEGLLDDDGHFNPNPDQPSRAHPDNETGERLRDEKGRFRGQDDALQVQDERTVEEDEAVPETETQEEEVVETAEVEADDDASASDEETEAIRTLEDVASAMDLSVDDLNEAITHTFKASGEEVTVNLAELVKGYQKDADYRRNTSKLAEERRAAEAEQETRLRDFDTQNRQLAEQFNVAEQLITSELNDNRLNALRSSDPAEWTARREEIGMRLNALRQARQQMAAQYEQTLTKHMEDLRTREQKALMEAVPDWSDEYRGKAIETVRSLGYTDQEIGQMMDHRLIKGVLELAELRAEVKQLKAAQTKAKDTVKRVKKEIPKLVKPGKKASSNTKTIQRDQLEKLKARARKSGSVRDAAKVIEQLL